MYMEMPVVITVLLVHLFSRIILVLIQRWEPRSLIGKQMVQGIITRRQDRPLLTTVLPVQVRPRTTSTAIRVLKVLATISDRSNTPTNSSMCDNRPPFGRGVFFSLDVVISFRYGCDYITEVWGSAPCLTIGPTEPT